MTPDFDPYEAPGWYALLALILLVVVWSAMIIWWVVGA